MNDNSHSNEKIENINKNVDYNNFDSNMKPMFNFLKEKIGEELLEQLLDLISFSNNESIIKSLSDNDGLIKKILGSYYKQVVLMIKYMITNSSENSCNGNNKNESELLSISESDNDCVSGHKKHNSVGGMFVFEKQNI